MASSGTNAPNKERIANIAEPNTTKAEVQKNEAEWRAYVGQYPDTADFPFEVGEKVWIVKPEWRAPLGEFRISKAHPGDLFELVKVSNNALHSELVEGKFLNRDPFRVTIA